ncbi:Ig-like domain-containing protein [Terrabacter sp. NPDC080008]|uniref:Ig-like domain-containing protein n=1 Tax=Terrabacter sp. NPDC080008 TaxID=3155176 RepID=UPI00344BEE81
MTRRPVAQLALAVAVALGVLCVVTSVLSPAVAFSGATFSSTSSNAVSTVKAASDWTPPTVSMVDPGSPVKGTVTVSANAADADSGVASVALQYLAPNGSGWVTLCTATAAPYACSWNTTGGADGSYGLRAAATDNAGYSTTSSTVQVTVANNLLVVLGNPGDIVRGTVPLTATLYNTGTVAYSVAIQYAVSGTTTWKTLCTATTAPYACSWSTAGAAFTQGESYDLRAVASAGTASSTSATVVGTVVDNVAPTVTVQDPGSPLRGTVSLGATASDAESGVSQVLIQLQLSGTSTWTTACTLTVDPFGCRYDTTKLADGTYVFRAVATDAAGNTTTSAVVGGRAVDNTVSSVSMEDPGAYLSGSATLNATASSTAGITSVRIDYAPTGTTSWAPVCTDTTAPYACSWDTTKVADGLYDLRAVLVDGKGSTTTSATVSARRIDNSPVRGYDVQTVSGGATAGKLDSGDVLRLTYSQQVDLTTITPGWTGSSLPVTLRLRDGAVLGLSGSSDTVDVLRNGAAVNLGSVNLKQDYIKSGKTAQFAATMVASTTTVGGVSATVVTITLGSTTSSSSLRTVTTAAAMVWAPSAGVTDLNKVPCSTAPTSELGTLDRDF